ncbi:MAG TPA: glutaredoxin family protein [Candidatus Limnocylindria bacterium]|nr:glutaredoxin family protein [Candidatus Limnocylindria bacterium]
MTPKLTLYSRRDCCLCEDMKETIRQAAEKIPMTVEEIDVDASAELQERYGHDVPLLYVDGKKAFKYRVTAEELRKRLGRGGRWKLWGSVTRGE